MPLTADHAALQAEDIRGEPGDHRQVVRHQHHRHPGGPVQIRDECVEVLFVLEVDAGGRVGRRRIVLMFASLLFGSVTFAQTPTKGKATELAPAASPTPAW